MVTCSSMKKKFLIFGLIAFAALLIFLTVQQPVSANPPAQKCRDAPLGPILCPKMPSLGSHVEVAWGLNTQCHGDVIQLDSKKKNADVSITEVNQVGCHANIGDIVRVTWKEKVKAR